MNAAEQELQQRRVRARAAFDAAGFAPTAWREHPGKEEAVVETLGRLADLIVLPNQAAAKDEIERAVTFERALMASGRPVLLAAAEPAAAPPGRIVMIAWNNSVQATRALAGAMPFCGAADRVLALTVASSKTRAEEADRLVRYLGRHGVTASALALEKSADVGAAILERAEAEGVDLLVMGGYSRSRMAEMIFGGVTRHMVGRATMPILMAY